MRDKVGVREILYGRHNRGLQTRTRKCGLRFIHRGSIAWDRSGAAVVGAHLMCQAGGGITLCRSTFVQSLRRRQALAGSRAGVGKIWRRHWFAAGRSSGTARSSGRLGHAACVEPRASRAPWAGGIGRVQPGYGAAVAWTDVRANI